ncbi:MAG TPA: CvpA family protein [Clostridiales bacterium]|nr:CvpA family protein [Clostridiales bacterium]
MGIVLDLFVVAIVAFVAWRSAMRGFVRTVIELVGYFLAFYISVTLSSPIATGIYDKFIDTAITNTVESNINQAVTSTTGEKVDEIWDSLPSIVVKSADQFGITKNSLSENINNNIKDSSRQVAAAVTQNIARPVIVGLIKAVISVVLFGLCMIGVKFLARFVNKCFNLPVIGTVNKVLGGVLGSFKGVVVAVIVCIIISTIIVITGNGFWIFTNDNISASTLFEYFCSFNPLFK